VEKKGKENRRNGGKRNYNRKREMVTEDWQGCVGGAGSGCKY
jgi:hypothetical protein